MPNNEKKEELFKPTVRRPNQLVDNLVTIYKCDL